MTWCTDRGIAGPHLPRLHPAVLVEVRGHFEVNVRDIPRRRNRIVLLHLEDDVRLADPPAVRILGTSRQILRVAFGGAGLDPPRNRALLIIREAPCIGEMADGRIGMPRRHRALRHLRRDGARPGARVLVGEQRHRRDLARPMADGAVLEEDRRDVLVERGLGLRLRLRAGCRREQQSRGDHDERRGQYTVGIMPCHAITADPRQEHAGRELAVRVQRTLDRPHLSDARLAVKLAQQALLERAPSNPVLRQRRATQADHATRDLEDRVASTVNVLEGAGNQIGVKVAVRDVAPYCVVEAARLEGGPVERDRFGQSRERDDGIAGCLLDLRMRPGLGGRDQGIDAGGHGLAESEQPVGAAIVIRRCHDRIAGHTGGGQRGLKPVERRLVVVVRPRPGPAAAPNLPPGEGPARVRRPRRAPREAPWRPCTRSPRPRTPETAARRVRRCREGFRSV